MATRRPSSFSLRSFAMADSTSSIITLSVTSKQSCRGSTPVSAMTSATCSHRSDWANCRPERFTVMTMGSAPG